LTHPDPKGTKVKAHRTPLSRIRPALRMRRANGSGAFGGAGAPGAGGSGAPAPRRAPELALLATALGVLLLFPALAQAHFVTAGTFGSSGSGDGQFGPAAPIGVAVDQSSGDVYLSDLLDNRVEKFDANGNYLSQFGGGGSAGGQFADPVGVAVDPTSGDVYVSDLANARVEKFDAEGNFILAFGGGVDQTTGANVCTAASGDECGPGATGSGEAQFAGGFGWFGNVLAVDSSGDVYVADGGNSRVEKFDSAGNYISQVTAHLSTPRSVAVDSAGDLYVADPGIDAVQKFDSSGAFLGSIGAGTNPSAVATDPAGDLFAFANAPAAAVLEYEPSGAQIDTIGANGLSSHFVNPGIAYGDTANDLYVAQPSGNDAWIFTKPAPPTVHSELVAELTSSEAKLGARIGPGGPDTSYRFEYGTTTAYGHTAPIPAGDAGTGLAARTVWAAATGLEPGTTYHYRVLASNELGTAEGPDQTFTTLTASESACPNEALRGGFSASLPDCRAYELVTPPNQASAEPDPLSYEIYRENGASSNGDRMSFYAIASLPGSAGDSESYLSSRGPGGWSTEDVIPLQAYYAFECPIRDGSAPAYSADMSGAVIGYGGNQRADNQFGGGCGAEAPEVLAGEPSGVENLLLRDNASRTYQLIDVTPPAVTPADARFAAASSDLAHVVFREAARLTPEALGGGVENLYEWQAGIVRLVSLLPDGTPVAASPAGISPDGSRVFFTAAGDLYTRLGGTSTVQLDASKAGGVGGGARFITATSDGSVAFFIDDASAALTADTAPGSGPNLYRYDFASGRLTDLTPQPGSEVQGVAGTSEDGSYVYFVANGDLASGATEGQPNLYLWHSGATSFIATLSSNDFCVGEASCARVSADGAYLAFASTQSLTGYENTNAGGFEVPEVFLYSAASADLACASCNPSGEAPTEGAILERHYGSAPRYLSSGGRVFFDTADALVPSDTNGQRDVYEYERGHIYLISSGTSASPSWLLDASASGDDVFFLTRQSLLPQDTNAEELSIYDARVHGGFPLRVSPPSCSTADACRPAPEAQPSIAGAPSSQAFSGAGNVKECPKGKVKKHGKCVKPKARKKHAKRHKKSHGRTASHKRGGHR
jgi:DNA-binding beta-propeller fold protein YncE